MAVPVADVGRPPAAMPQIDAGRVGGTGADLDSVRIAEGGGARNRRRRCLWIILNPVFPVVVGQQHDAGVSSYGSLCRPVPRGVPEVGFRSVLVEGNAVGGVMGMAVSLRKQISMESNRSKYILAGLTAFCILLIGITSLKDGIMEPLRTGVGYFLIPIQSGVNKVGTGLYNELTDYGKLKAALAENENLKTQVAQLTEDNNRLQAEQFELNRLRQLYKLDQEYMQYNKIGARVIARDSEKWFQVFRINKGSSDGVAVDMNVVADGGLVGIVTDVGANYATVRSIIDDSSRVGAMSLDSSYNCIVAGDLTLYEQGRLKLTDFSRDAVLRNGDQIITSNISTKYLPGILIGYAVDVSIDPDHLTQSGYLIPAADFDNLQEVLILTDLKNSDEAVE